MAKRFGGSEDESLEELHEYLHGLLGYGSHSDNLNPHPWEDLPKSALRLALAAVSSFQAKHARNIIAQRLVKKIEAFFDSQRELHEDFCDFEEALRVGQLIALSQPLYQGQPSLPQYEPSLSNSQSLFPRGELVA